MRDLALYDRFPYGVFVGQLPQRTHVIFGCPSQVAHWPPSSERVVDFLDLESGPVSLARYWNANAHDVTHHVGLGERDSEYYATLWIEWAIFKDTGALDIDQEMARQRVDAAKDS